MTQKRGYDVLVAGGGVAGVAAALSAARVGMKTALIEKSILWGGLATAGLVNIYLPLCDGRGTQVTFGLAEKLLLQSIRYGPGDVPADWRNPGQDKNSPRYLAVFAPAALVLALDELLIEAGVELWLDTLICAPVMEGDRVAGVVVENQDGRGEFRARCVVDATGTALVAARAGAECVDEPNKVDIWAMYASLHCAREAVENNSGEKLLRFFRIAGDETAEFRETDASQYTQFVMESRRRLREHLTELRAKGQGHGRQDLYPLAVPSQPQFRRTRRIVGRKTMSDGQDGQHVPDSVGLVADWRKAGPVWEVPYGALVPAKTRGLLTAGRCISSEGDAWEITRVIPAAALTGEVAGVAASLAVQHSTTPDALDSGGVQEALRQRGIPLHLSDVGL